MRALLLCCVLLALSACSAPEPQTAPPVVLPSHDPLPTADPIPTPTLEPHRVVGQNIPDDPEVRAAVEAYIALETAMFDVIESGGSPESEQAALEYVDTAGGQGSSEFGVRDVAYQARRDGPIRMHGTTTVRYRSVLERENDAIALEMCVDSSRVHSPSRTFPAFTSSMPWMVRSTDGSWRLYSFSVLEVDEC